jgi:hypothetical protein
MPTSAALANKESFVKAAKELLKPEIFLPFVPPDSLSSLTPTASQWQIFHL